jgi:predicted ester cyclase
MQKTFTDATSEHLDVFANETGDMVVSRWITRGTNNGMFGLPADTAPVSFTGIAIWRVEDGRLAECWVERSALELYNHLRGV